VAAIAAAQVVPRRAGRKVKEAATHG